MERVCNIGKLGFATTPRFCQLLVQMTDRDAPDSFLFGKGYNVE